MPEKRCHLAIETQAYLARNGKFESVSLRHFQNRTANAATRLCRVRGDGSRAEQIAFRSERILSQISIDRELDDPVRRNSEELGRVASGRQ